VGEVRRRLSLLSGRPGPPYVRSAGGATWPFVRT